MTEPPTVDAAAKRAHTATTPSHRPSLSLHNASSSSTPQSSWAQLPTELLSLIVSFTSLRGVVNVASVNPRLHRLLLQAGVHDSSSNDDVWRHYPPVTLVVDENIGGDLTVERRVVSVGDEQFRDTGPGSSLVPTVLSVLRRITSLRLEWVRSAVDYLSATFDVPLTTFPSLQHLTRLRTFEVRGLPFIIAASLAAALDSLPGLTILHVPRYNLTESDDVIVSLRRMCSTQLDHLTVSRRQLHFLILQQRAPMSHLRSLTVTQSPELQDYAGRPMDVIDNAWVGQFPALLHLDLSDQRLLQQMTHTQPPHLSSFTVRVHDVAEADFTLVHTRALCLRCYEDEEDGTPPNFREQLRRVLTRAPLMQQLSLSVTNQTDSAAAAHVFLPASAAPSTLSRLIYLEFLDGFTLSDLTYLLTAAAPPIFAAQLTHLALRVRWQDRTAAAALLPSLPSLYPSLTHAHVSVQPEPISVQMGECGEWDVALQAVKAALGSAWCASATDVVVWREDVAWNRSVGLPA